MRSTASNFAKTSASALFIVLASFAWLSLGSTVAVAQQVRSTDFKADQSLKSNARVNPSTRAMELSIPLTGYAGRAGTGLPVTLSYSSKLWQIEAVNTWWTNQGGRTAARPVYAKLTAAGWTSSLAAPRIDAGLKVYEGAVEGSLNEGQPYVDDLGENPPQTRPLYYVKRVQVIMPDGAAHEFRASDQVIFCGYTTDAGCTADLTGTYLSVDATAMRLDYAPAGSTLYLPDGTRYLFGAQPSTGDYRAFALLDRHGNRQNYDAALRRWTDTLGRVIDDPLPYNADAEQSQTVGDQTAHFPSRGGTFDVTFSWRQLKASNGGDSALEDPAALPLNLSDLTCDGNLQHPTGVPHLFNTPATTLLKVCDSFSNSAGGTNWQTAPPFNPVVLTKITLPNGQFYEFKYNVYGEIIRIVYPTGASERLDYEAVLPLQPQGSSYDQSNRGVRERRVSARGDGTDDLLWAYGPGTEESPNGMKTEQLLHTEPSYVPQPYGFGTPRIGRPYEERARAAGGALLSRRLTDYEWTGSQSGGNSAATRDLRPKREITITFEPNATSALATLSETIYETPGQNNAPTDPAYFAALNARQTKSYHYVALSATDAANQTIEQLALLFAGASPAAVSEKDYLYDANHLARNINGLATETRIKDAAGNLKAQTHVDYDEANYLPAATVFNATNWTNPQTDPGAPLAGIRGLPTTTKIWNDTTGTWITMHAEYDQFGNARKAWDGRGNVAEVQYADNYADGVNRNSYALPTKTISYAGAGGTGTLFETTVKYDFNTGLPVSTKDANDLETRMEYNDPLLRPTKAQQYFGGLPIGAASETVYGAGTSEATRYVKSRTQIDETRWKEGYSWYDGLSRPTKTQSVDANGDVFALTCYDAVGRVQKSSNPFRGAANASCAASLEWTSVAYDAAGRAWKTTTPDGAAVQTDYAIAATGDTIGTAITVTDQAGKQRRSITNALGQLKRVDEPTDTNGLGAINVPNQATYYAYDTLNNLTTVQQTGTNAIQCGTTITSCSQTRTFVYDSLSRLKTATNPESGLIQYQYDSNGNLTLKTDARNVQTSYVYDALNRVTQRNYANEPGGQSATPNVTYIYDGLSHAKGKLTKVITGNVSTPFAVTDYQAFDEVGRVTQSQQTIDGTAYGMPQTYTYNLSGALIEEKYPSGRVVKNVLDNDGDLAIVQSKKNANAGYFNYAKSFTYTAAGAVSSMQLGNGKWESTVFNSRLQPTQIALGGTPNATNLLKLNFAYNSPNSTTDNNGNVVSQTITTPSETHGATTYPAFVATQNYTYDSLNRLKSAEETSPTQPGWRQTYLYDRFGNRNFDTGSDAGGIKTTTLPLNCATAVCNPAVDPNTNKLIGYVFDNAGNTKTDANGQTFVYDAENKQTLVKNSSNVVIGEYFYDGDGKRVKKVVPATGETTVFVYDAGSKLVAEYANQISATPQVSYLTSDHLGSPRINTDVNGIVTSRHDYMPFGEEVTRTSYGADEVRKQFGTYQRDWESNLDYAQARYYNKNLGRFNSVDPIIISKEHLANPQRWNAYVYVLNCPTTAIDPDGKRPRRTIDIFITLDEPGAKNPRFNKDIKARYDKLIKSAAKRGVRINIYRTDNNTATVEKFTESIQAKNRTTILIGHSNPSQESLDRGLGNGVYYGDGVGFADGRFLTRQENIDKNIGTDTVDNFNVNAKNIAVFTCDCGATFDKLKSENKTNFISLDNGKYGVSSPSAGLNAGLSVARVIANGGTASQAQESAQRAFDNSNDINDTDGDSVKLRVIKP